MFGAIQGVANIFRQKKANKALDQLLGQDVRYQQNPFAKQQLNTAQQLFGGRMFGAPQLERNIFSNQGMQLSNIGRNATDSSQALALGAAAQGNTNQALSDLQIKEAQNKYSLLGNLNQAYGTMINEGGKDYQDKVRRFGNLASIRGQQQQNKTNALNGVFNGLNSDINQALSIAGLFANPLGFLGGAGGSGAGGSFSNPALRYLPASPIG